MEFDYDIELEKLRIELDRAEKLREKFFSVIPSTETKNSSNITVNAGGVGVWACLSAVLVLSAMNVMLAFVVLNHDRRIDDAADYSRAFYSQVPEAKELLKKYREGK